MSKDAPFLDLHGLPSVLSTVRVLHDAWDRWEAQKEAERAALRLWCISLGTPTGAR